SSAERLARFFRSGSSRLQSQSSYFAGSANAVVRLSPIPAQPHSTSAGNASAAAARGATFKADARTIMNPGRPTRLRLAKAGALVRIEAVRGLRLWRALLLNAQSISPDNTLTL